MGVCTSVCVRVGGCECVVQGTYNWISRHAFISVMETAAFMKGSRAEGRRREGDGHRDRRTDRQTRTAGGAKEKRALSMRQICQIIVSYDVISC